MPATNVCWGVELGAGAIKAVKLERDGEKINVLEYAVIPHKKVLSTPDLDQADATRVALGQLVSQFDLTSAPVAISIPGHSAFARFAKLPPVEPKKIPDIVKFEAVQQIPFPIEDVEWDYQTFTSKDSPDVEVGIFAVMREKVMERLATFAEVGVTPAYVTIGPVAVYNSVAWDQGFNDKTPGTVVLDICTTSTDLLVCEPGRVWVRTFQVGGHQFTEALVNAFKLSYSKAETLKAQVEQSSHARHVLQALRPVFGDLAQEVQRSIGYYQSSHRDANLTRLIALGSTFNLPGLRKFLGQQLQMEVIRLERFNRMSLDGPRAAEFEAATINMATAYGLALQGLGFEHGIMVNLMPVSIVREALWKKKTKWFAGAAAISLAAGGVAFFKPLLERSTMPTPDPQIANVSGEIKRLQGKWKEVEGGFKTDYRAANIAQLLSSRDIYPHLVNDLGTMLADANAKAASDEKDKTGLTFLGFNGRYSPPGAAGAAGAAGGGAGAPQDDRSGGGGGAPPGEPVTNPAGARVSVELAIETHRGAPDRFVTDTITKWLREADSKPENRAKVPYTIDPKSVRFDMETRVVPKPDQPAPGSGNVDGGGAIGGPGASGGGGGGGGRLGGGGSQPSGLGATGGLSAPQDDRGGGMGATGGASAPIGGNGGSGGASNAELDKLAEIPPAAGGAPPGATVARFKVYFDVIIKGAEPKAENKS